WDTRDVYADIIFNHAVSKHHLSERDRALTQEIFFGVLRWRGKLDWILQQLFVGKWEKSPRSVKNILFVGLYQLMFLDRIPAYAVINEAVNEAKQRVGKYWSGKINAILRNWANGKSRVIFPDLAESPVDAVAVQYSHPRWLVQRWIKRWGVEQTVKLCQANNERPGVSLRVNCLKKTPTEFYNLLANIEVEIKPSNDNPRFFQSDQISGLSELEAFQKGYFSIQDESAGLPCQLLNPQPGEVIVDLCSAPGGKTTYLAELTENRSTIVSVDKNFKRLLLLRENLHRLGLNAGRLVCCDGRYFSVQKADKVLVDAPCSGLGVLSKRADLRWKRSESTIKQLAELQL
ncbi:MAG: 16S rRNA (cytosine(967)-C(5))-methyltransferase RsmB, partial [bacterium]|nr:16S rRNA (cytosine(967)-C(5))-methyltransferase RsmB [bacterium]